MKQLSDSQINKPQHEHPKRAELPDVNINTGAQSINIESFLKLRHQGENNSDSFPYT